MTTWPAVRGVVKKLALFHFIIAVALLSSMLTALFLESPVSDLRLDLGNPTYEVKHWIDEGDRGERFTARPAAPSSWRQLDCRFPDRGDRPKTTRTGKGPPSAGLTLDCQLTHSGFFVAGSPDAFGWLETVQDGPGYEIKVVKPLLWPAEQSRHAQFAYLLHLILAIATVIGWRSRAVDAWGDGWGAIRMSLQQGWLALPILAGLAAALLLSSLGIVPGATLAPMTGINLALFLVSAIIFAPVAEEVFYRGWMVDSLAHNVRPSLAVLLSANAFALMHVPNSVGMWCFYAVMALSLSWLRSKSRSIAPPILAHALFNGIVLLDVIPMA